MAPAAAVRSARESSAGPIAITGLGLTTSLAQQAVASCAAARVGMVRPTELDLTSQDPDGGSVPVKGHCARGVTDGFVGVGRLLRLAQPALDDLIRSAPGLDAVETTFFLHVGDHFYDAAADADDPAAEREKLFAEAPEEAVEQWAEAELRLRAVMLDALARRLGVPPERAVLTRGGAAGLVGTLTKARALLAQGAARRCVVGAVDSLVDPRVALKLARLGLLQTPENPVGFAPGEAAGFVLLERARAPGAIGTLAGLGFARAAEHRFSDRPASGTATRAAVRAAAQELARGLDAAALIVSLSGDEYRANDLGTAIAGLKAQGMLGGNVDLWYPAISFGETGAAAVMIAIAIALRAFARGYAPSPDLVAIGISDDGGRGSVVLSDTSRGAS